MPISTTTGAESAAGADHTQKSGSITMQQIHRRQDEVATRLDDLNLQIENLIALYTANRRAADEVGDPVDSAKRDAA